MLNLLSTLFWSCCWCLLDFGSFNVWGSHTGEHVGSYFLRLLLSFHCLKIIKVCYCSLASPLLLARSSYHVTSSSPASHSRVKSTRNLHPDFIQSMHTIPSPPDTVQSILWFSICVSFCFFSSVFSCTFSFWDRPYWSFAAENWGRDYPLERLQVGEEGEDGWLMVSALNGVMAGGEGDEIHVGWERKKALHDNLEVV